MTSFFYFEYQTKKSQEKFELSKLWINQTCTIFVLLMESHVQEKQPEFEYPSNSNYPSSIHQKSAVL